MKSECIEVVSVALHLTEEEAEWLRGYMQNPMVHPDDEEPLDREMRKRFFDATELNKR